MVQVACRVRVATLISYMYNVHVAGLSENNSTLLALKFGILITSSKDLRSLGQQVLQKL